MVRPSPNASLPKVPARTHSSPTGSARIHQIITWVARCFLLTLIVVLPWKNGAVDWEWQYWMVWTIPLQLTCIVLLTYFRPIHAAATVPRFAIILFALASVGFLQSLSLFSNQGSSWQPAAIQIQRWFQGQDVNMSSQWFSQAMQDSYRELHTQAKPATTNADKTVSTATRGLAISADPLHTQAAALVLCTAALLLWLSSLAFQNRQGDMILLTTLVAIGIVMACLFLVQVVSVQPGEWDSAEIKRPLATFKSKNVAAAFLNTGLAAAIGLGVGLLQFKKRSSDRYAIVNERPSGRLQVWLLDLTDFFLGLKTLHIIVLLAMGLLTLAVFGSQSRGAALGASVAFVSLGLALKKARSSIGLGVIALFLVLVLVGGLIYLDLDSRVEGRFTQLLQGDSASQVGRIVVWWGALRASLFYWMTGCGLGNFGYGLLPFMDAQGDLWFYYSECMWGHLLAEFGIVGLALFLYFLWELYRWWLNRSSLLNHHRSSLFFACWFLLACTLFHAMVDFCLIVPAIFVPFVILLGATCKPRSIEARSQPHRPSPNPPRVTPDPDLPAQSSAFRAWIMPILCGGIGLGIFSSTIPTFASLRKLERMEKQLAEIASNETSKIAAMVNEWKEDRWQEPHFLRMNALLRSADWRLNYQKYSQEELQLKLDWDQTTPILVRLGIQRLQAQKSTQLDKLLGGAEAKAELQNIQQLYATASKSLAMDYRVQLGAILFDIEGNQELQKQQLRRWLPLGQNAPLQLLEAGLLQVELGDQTPGLQTLTLAMRLQPKLALSIVPILLSKLEDGQLDIQMLPEDPILLIKIAESLAPAEALPRTRQQIWEQARHLLEQKPADSFEYWQALANCHRQRTAPQEEAVALREALEIRPNVVTLWIRLIEAHLAMRDVALAKQTLEEALRINPNNRALEKWKAEIRSH